MSHPRQVRLRTRGGRNNTRVYDRAVYNLREPLENTTWRVTHQIKPQRLKVRIDDIAERSDFWSSGENTKESAIRVIPIKACLRTGGGRTAAARSFKLRCGGHLPPSACVYSQRSAVGCHVQQ